MTTYVQDPIFDIEPMTESPLQKTVTQPLDIAVLPLRVLFTVALMRKGKRARCARCSMYRVVFILRTSSGEESLPICGKCAGIR